jgi:hypothetical protein
MGYRCERAEAIDRAQHLARALGWPYIDLEEYSISCGLLRRIPASIATLERCVPLVFNARRIVLVVDNPFNGAYMAANPGFLGVSADHRIELALTTPAGIDAALHRRAALVRG